MLDHDVFINPRNDYHLAVPLAGQTESNNRCTRIAADLRLSALCPVQPVDESLILLSEYRFVLKPDINGLKTHAEKQG
ncbi:hypothetical protein BOO35_16265 [Vibrio navarrensis]|nr:hypothetical protein [Vibrio navarrensis]